ncbi:bolA-like protein 3 isoform X1 [Nomascus leucogenys]|uniref:bolA-like protein 3 isoform X1 n=1 Tax=Nomascus leucogenys TaxID=61853 RepID=UPI00122D674C|nr:bolA-like protein 3 isoform X1 [Nomascus leucogenys]
MAAWSPAAAAPLLRGIRGLPLHHRMFATQTEGELRVTQILKEKFPRATAIKVTDISGGARLPPPHGMAVRIQKYQRETEDKAQLGGLKVASLAQLRQGTKRRNQRNAWIADIYLCPQTLTTPWLHRCCCLRPWMNFTDIILP